MSGEIKMFPVISERGKPSPVQIPWSMAERAYSQYVHDGGSGQSLVRVGERGGFYVSELDKYIPGWREELSELSTLLAQLEEARKENAAIESAIAKEFSNDPTGTNKRSGDLLEDFACWIEHHAKVEQERDSLKQQLAAAEAKCERTTKDWKMIATCAAVADRAVIKGIALENITYLSEPPSISLEAYCKEWAKKNGYVKGAIQ